MALNIPQPKDKRQKRWQARTFMGMVAAMIQSNRWASRGVGSALSIRMPGFPLKHTPPGAHCSRPEERRVSQKAKRQARQRRIRRRGWA